MRNVLLKFCLIVAAVLTLVAGLDIVLGKTMDNLLSRVGSVGQLGKTNYAIHEIDAPILVVGSSRASHHYDSRMLTDSLKIKTYNIGRDGCLFTHNACIINTILDRYAPYAIIWEFNPSYLCDSEDTVTSLYPYYGELDYITETLNSELPYNERVKLHSNIYRYNSIFLRILMRCIQKNSSSDPSLGYELLPPKTLITPLVLSSIDSRNQTFDERRMLRLKRTLDYAKSKGVKMILITSPMYGVIQDSRSFDKLAEICASAGALYFDNTQLYLDKPEYFNDLTHMNCLGAEQYTKEIIYTIKDALCEHQ